MENYDHYKGDSSKKRVVFYFILHYIKHKTSIASMLKHGFLKCGRVKHIKDKVCAVASTVNRG